jgi:hypothetical protein
LAERLVERLQPRSDRPILDFASGSGRNGEVLRRAGFAVISIDDEVAASDAPLAAVAQKCVAVISTHGLLHGTPAAIAQRLGWIVEHLADAGLLYATFGSKRDARFGCGKRIDASTFAPNDGDERGVAHAYFDRGQLCAMLEPCFEVESLGERGVDDVAGRWAHRARPLAGSVHWFVVARKR